jgi:hypothetical protein
LKPKTLAFRSVEHGHSFDGHEPRSQQKQLLKVSTSIVKAAFRVIAAFCVLGSSRTFAAFATFIAKGWDGNRGRLRRNPEFGSN